jgi:hypothetical protein
MVAVCAVLSNEPDINYSDIALQTFDPCTLVSYMSLRSKLDAYCEAGIPEDQFRQLFTQCLNCHKFMTYRTQEYHECPKSDCPDIPDTARTADALLLYIDCYGGGPGLSAEQFEKIFAQCTHCCLYMTRYAAKLHNCSVEEM